jgi:hypothetical protein
MAGQNDVLSGFGATNEVGQLALGVADGNIHGKAFPDAGDLGHAMVQV